MTASNGAKLGSTAHTSQVEEALARVPGVQGSRVVMDTSGRISEVHVLASGDRTPKQIVRDVTTTIQAGFGLVVDYRMVSVARLDADAAPPAPLSSNGNGHTTNGNGNGRGKPQTIEKKNLTRPSVDVVAASSKGRTTQINVQLRHEGKTYEGAARGPANSALALAAVAAVDAVGEFLGDNAVEVRSAEIAKSQHGHLVALVILGAITDRGEETWCGSALVRKDPSDAIVRATFSAMNRSLPGEPGDGNGASE